MNTKDTKLDFDEYIMEKYPNLFRKDAEGKSLPPECGFYCPIGWEHIVEQLCKSIDYRMMNPKQVQVRKIRYKVYSFMYKRMFQPIYHRIYRLVDPYEKLHWENGKRNSSIILHPNATDACNLAHPHRKKIKIILSKFSSFMRPKYNWKSIPCDPVIIDQVKEKFGTLRFYYSGGEEHISSIVSFAESMSGCTCADTGHPGELHRKGFWYKTLSKDRGKELDYYTVK